MRWSNYCRLMNLSNHFAFKYENYTAYFDFIIAYLVQYCEFPYKTVPSSIDFIMKDEP